MKVVQRVYLLELLWHLWPHEINPHYSKGLTKTLNLIYIHFPYYTLTYVKSLNMWGIWKYTVFITKVMILLNCVKT